MRAGSGIREKGTVFTEYFGKGVDPARPRQRKTKNAGTSNHLQGCNHWLRRSTLWPIEILTFRVDLQSRQKTSKFSAVVSGNTCRRRLFRLHTGHTSHPFLTANSLPCFSVVRNTFPSFFTLLSKAAPIFQVYVARARARYCMYTV